MKFMQSTQCFLEQGAVLAIGSQQVVGIELKARARSVPAQYVLVTQVVTEGTNKITLEPYCINDTYYQMVMEAPKPYIDGFKLNKKQSKNNLL